MFVKRHRMLAGFCAAAMIWLAAAAGSPQVVQSSGGITLTQISTPFNNPVGIDHHHTTNKVVISANYPSGHPRNFELVAADGSRTGFSGVSGLTDELKIATARDDGGGMSLGGFPAGTLFSGTGTPGHILRVSPDGATVWNPWVVLPGEPGLMRGSLYVDRTGVWGGDLIVVTTAGRVWRVNAAGTPTLLASLGVHLEGVITMPNDPAKYGPWAGKILAGAEGQGRIYAIGTSGPVTIHTLGINPEDFDLIPPNENFYGVNFGSGRLLGAEASQWTSMVGDLLVTQEYPGILWQVKWNGTSFVKTKLVETSQWEHVTFSPAGVVEIPAACPVTGGQPTLTFKAPLSSSSTAAMPNGTNLPIAFQFCGNSGFIHDESVVMMIVDLATGMPVTAWVYGFDIAIDDTAMEYTQTFRSGDYGLAPGQLLEVQVFLADTLAGQAQIQVTGP